MSRIVSSEAPYLVVWRRVGRAELCLPVEVAEVAALGQEFLAVIEVRHEVFCAQAMCEVDVPAHLLVGGRVSGDLWLEGC